MHAVIDTNVLIYDTFSDSEFHKESRSLLNSLDRWYIPSIVLQEYVWFFRSQGFSSREAKIMLSEYISDPRFRGLVEDHNVILRAIDILERENLSLSRFNDMIILVHAIEKGTLATFDQKLRKLARKLSVEILP
ncbi:PIN domain-containing protein [Pyrococcus furiosus DSM 3638]|uniref:PIN domain-containing protein n=3 Tax=Pyrococcus furiosus TaxID=2261 RepID=A0A5C0XNQ8_PYRFU|nr:MULTISPECIES: PIN domain-containing protein [Pyrococcus]AAL80698.1 hypothetical protein PF0574 [Pyrococcus furiosus DSM 3638]AFN03367.1 hypothetical protein PFC_02000 [Pyrococcus furiosus COM1]MDK2869408.1 uncharacterized protein [Pyrococcus sp.]QEK78281.1 PIN domain-containing protein [Pyrococcus furiosus DSM 3638]